MSAKKINPFKLRDFRRIDPNIITRLEAIQIKTTHQMLIAGQTAEKRAALARKTGISEADVLELVKLSDLARLPGVKGIRTRLYYDAGVDTVEKLAAYEPDQLLALTSEFVRETSFEGVPPLAKEVSSTIANARKLPKIVEW